MTELDVIIERAKSSDISLSSKNDDSENYISGVMELKLTLVCLTER